MLRIISSFDGGNIEVIKADDPGDIQLNIFTSTSMLDPLLCVFHHFPFVMVEIIPILMMPGVKGSMRGLNRIRYCSFYSGSVTMHSVVFRNFGGCC